MAMPETVLGLFPDVGATWFLTRCPGAIGRYLALVGHHIGAADAITAGLATHHAPYSSFDALVAGLAAAERLDAAVIGRIIEEHSTSPAPGMLNEHQAQIDELFIGEDLDHVVAALDDAAPASSWIAEAAAVLRRASPTSLRATWRRLIDGEGQSFERILTDDFRMATRMVGGGDFAEGVRAILIDKDMKPRRQPASLADVTEADLDALLAPLEEDLDLRGTE